MMDKENQTRQEILDDYKSNMLIEALAGAGKTTILVERLLRQVRTVKPSQIVAITFTEKAADELKGRFQKRLLEEYKRSEGEEKQAIQQAVEQMNEIQISTIHSFCHKLLQEMSFEAGLGLDFQVVQEAEEMSAMKTFFEGFCRDAAQKTDRQRLAQAGINIEQLFGTFVTMCQKRNVTEWVYDRSIASDPNSWNHLMASIQRKKILWDIVDCLTCKKTIETKKSSTEVDGFTAGEILDGGSRNGVADPVITDLGRQIFRYVTENQSGMDGKGVRLILKLKTTSAGALSGVCVSSNKSDKTFDADLLEKAKASYKLMKACDFGTKILECKEEWNEYLHAVCMGFLEKACQAYWSQSVRGGSISNDDLLIKTRDMLLHSSKARDYYRETYRYFYIDEYQDTDPVQTEILQLLTATEDTIGKSLQDTEFMDGRFCLIGDPKQSIYAFRGADVRLYAKMRAVIEKKDNCRLYQMNRNYRSNYEICSWVNNKYRKSAADSFGFATCVEVEQSGSTQAGFDQMLSAQTPGDSTKYVKGVYPYMVGGDKKEDIIWADSHHVAAMIRNMLDQKVCLSIMNTKTGTSEIRPVEPGDFMIITRKKEGLREYAAALKAKGIPVLVNGASSISLGDGNGDEGSMLTGFKKLLLLSDFVAETSKRNRSYKLALILVKIFGIPVSPVELFTYCDAIYGEEAEKNLENISDSNVAEALTILREWVSLSKRNPLLAFERMAQAYNIILKKENTRPDLLAELGAVEQILEQLREETYGSYSELNEKLQKILQGKNEKELPMGEEASRKAVYIMNAHQAKGLEANIVILACPAYEPPEYRDKVIEEETADAQGNRVCKGYVDVTLDAAYAGASRFGTVSAGKSQGFEAAREPKVILHQEEELRVLYVAGTRAKECLIIGESGKPSVWTALTRGLQCIDLEDSFTPDYQKMIVQGELYQGTGSAGACAAVGKKVVAQEMAAYETLYNRKKEEIETLTGVGEITIKPSLQEIHSSTDQVDPAYMCGNLYGTIMHRFFELLIGQEWRKKQQYEAGQISLEEITTFGQEELTGLIRRAVWAGLESESLSPKQCERLKIDPALAQQDRKTQLEKLAEHLTSEYTNLAKGILKDSEFQKDLMEATAIFPEIPFELKYRPEDIPAIAGYIREGYQQGQMVRVRGTMDLLMETGDQFIVWDYKSDVIKIGETIPEFTKRLYGDYEPQLQIYQSALRTMVADDSDRSKKSIQTKLYHRFRNES